LSLQLKSYKTTFRKVFYIDVDRCIDCKSCEVACAREHKSQPLIFVQSVGEYSVPLHCRHCEVNVCIEVCPKEAIEKNELGIVKINEIKCIGCKACIVACPFGILRLDEVSKVVVKCDLCWERLEKDLLPICVLTCPTGALQFIPCIGCNACVAACPFAKSTQLLRGKEG